MEESSLSWGLGGLQGNPCCSGCEEILINSGSDNLKGHNNRYARGLALLIDDNGSFTKMTRTCI